uniref:Uncharacterized protein n=1 Tax=Solanum lycopersicum TaxID=4081 RepID=A0A3Q7J630_SOLLC
TLMALQLLVQKPTKSWTKLFMIHINHRIVAEKVEEGIKAATDISAERKVAKTLDKKTKDKGVEVGTVLEKVEEEMKEEEEEDVATRNAAVTTLMDFSIVEEEDELVQIL